MAVLSFQSSEEKKVREPPFYSPAEEAKSKVTRLDFPVPANCLSPRIVRGDVMETER